jgi:SAM-dependent methyltransferase
MTKKNGTFADIFTLSWGFAGQRVLATAARTGVLGHLAGGLTTAGETAATLGIDELATGKVLRALHALGVVEARGDRYALAEPLKPLFLPGEGDITPFVAHSDGLNDFWGATLEGWVRTGLHPHRMRDAEGQKRFGAAMKALAIHLAPRVVEELGLSTVRRSLDLGGGVGTYATVFCQAAPELQATVVEHPEVCELGRAEVVRAGLGDRIDFRGGSYLDDDLGEGYDLVLLANVLHQEQAEAAQGLIARAASTLAPGGRLAVVDFRIDDDQREELIGALFAINMRSFGDTYPAPVIHKWMEGAGLTSLERRDLAPAHWLLVGQRPRG